MQTHLPPKLLSEIGSEPIDFTVFTKRMATTTDSIKGIAVTVVFLSFFGLLLYQIFFKSLVDTDFDILEMLRIFMGFIFTILGIGILIIVLNNFLAKGGHFVGTPTRLILHKKEKITSFRWEEFTGSVHIDVKQKSLAFTLRLGEKYHDKDCNKYEPQYISIISVENFWQIEQIARKRIVEAYQNSINNPQNFKNVTQ